ncbi:PREDICTED: protein TIC 55, chloroplastic-like [Camelina sativa]|uniref:Protein TIC 55, chloroplastic-like n=1 Tax=Camelina sativa TaxID=90675 RepID=A0ABM1QFV8_CAMSA|nr:PREDICTED: protein TIC 55, chloroplastic-like [Camelina sativa]
MAVPFLSSSFQLTATSPILFSKVKTPIVHKHFKKRTAPTKPRFHLLRCSAASGTAVVDQTEGGGGGEVFINPEEEKRVEVADYDWTEEWYPLHLTRNVPEDAPLGLTVFDSQIVLYKDGDGTLCCYEDRCPHRLAKLSEGQLIDGRLECLYHGWQFEGDGKCVKIPQVFVHSLTEDAQPLVFEVTERTNRGFAGTWSREKDGGNRTNLLRFDAPCVLPNNLELEGKDGVKNYFSGVFLCRPTGQGKSMLIVRFGVTKMSPLVSVLPQWFWHQNGCKVFEQDMGFLSSQNEILMKEKVPTKDLYLNLKSSDTWVAEYRKWMDKVGHGMPYHFGHRTISLPKVPPVVEHAPAGIIAALSASYPAKGGIGTMHAPNLANRYFRHIIHCRSCSKAIKSFELWKNILSATAVVLTTLAILVVSRQWKAVLLGSAALLSAAAYGCLRAIELNTNNFIRTHRRL